MAEERRLNVGYNKGLRRIELHGLAGGTKVWDINFTVEQAVHHIKAMIEAVDAIQGKPPSGSPLILPKDMQ